MIHIEKASLHVIKPMSYKKKFCILLNTRRVEIHNSILELSTDVRRSFT